jgi:hypothetical protein
MNLINDYRSKAEQLSETGYQVKIESYISKGITIFRMKMTFFILYTIIYIACMWIPIIGFLISVPLMAGFIISAHYLVSGKPLHFEDMFDGFRHFAGLLLFTIISSFFIILGFIALVIPGVYLFTSYIFAPLFIVFAKMDFWDAMEKSRKMVHKEWFSIFVFVLVLGLLNLLGIVALGIGLLFTIPITFCSLYAAFDDIVGVNK